MERSFLAMVYAALLLFAVSHMHDDNEKNSSRFSSLQKGIVESRKQTFQIYKFINEHLISGFRVFASDIFKHCSVTLLNACICL